jgi:acetyl esterase/lipase
LSNSEIAAIRALLGGLPPAASVEESRGRYESVTPMFPMAPDVTATPETIAGVRCEWSATPLAHAKRVVLYLHGGGYVGGSVASHRHLAAEVGRAAGARALAVDYRLAPEHPFPAAVDDALAVYRHLLNSGRRSCDIVIAGDSAGGGLTVATLLAAKAAGLPQPACAFCISPWVDLECVGESMVSQAADEPMVVRAQLLDYAGLYLKGAPPRTALAAPMYGDFAGLAPLLIQVGSAEVLMDDAVRLARAAGAARVPVQLEIWPEMIHVWHFFHRTLTDARRALAQAGAFIKSHFDPLKQ